MWNVWNILGSDMRRELLRKWMKMASRSRLWLLGSRVALPKHKSHTLLTFKRNQGCFIFKTTIFNMIINIKTRQEGQKKWTISWNRSILLTTSNCHWLQKVMLLKICFWTLFRLSSSSWWINTNKMMKWVSKVSINISRNSFLKRLLIMKKKTNKV